MTEKEGLRGAMRGALGALDPALRAAWSERIARRAARIVQSMGAKRVLLFSGTRAEPDTARLIALFIGAGKRVYLPRTLGKGMMQAVRVQDMDRLVPGRYGILEPADGEIAQAEALDCLFIPCVAFDARGGRLGHGAGYYDRFLERAAGRTCALAFDMQRVDCVPMHAHDRRMDCVVTQCAVYRDEGEAEH